MFFVFWFLFCVLFFWVFSLLLLLDKESSFQPCLIVWSKMVLPCLPIQLHNPRLVESRELVMVAGGNFPNLGKESSLGDAIILLALIHKLLNHGLPLSKLMHPVEPATLVIHVQPSIEENWVSPILFPLKRLSSCLQSHAPSRHHLLSAVC